MKRPPPSVTEQAQNAADPEAPSGAGGGGTGGEEMERGTSVSAQTTQDLVIVGNIPVSSQNDITQVTQVTYRELEITAGHHFYDCIAKMINQMAFLLKFPFATTRKNTGLWPIESFNGRTN